MKGIHDLNYCCYCGKFLVVSHFDYTREHVVPKSKGGNESSLNKIGCCKTCNHLRGNQNLSQFRNYVMYHLKNNLKLLSYTKYDLEIMIENIDHINDFVQTNKIALIKK